MKVGKAIALIVVGVIMVYVGYFGIPTGMPFALVTGNTVTDDFNDNYIDASVWEVYTKGGALVEETNQRLEVSASTGDQHGGLVTRNTYDQPHVEVQAWLISIDKAILGVSPIWDVAGDSYRLLVERKVGSTDWDYTVRYNPLGDDQGQVLTTGVCNGNEKLRIVVSSTTVTFSVGTYQVHSEASRLTSPIVEVRFWMVRKAAHDTPGSGYFDNFYMTYEGGAPPPPDTGTVKVFAWDKTGGEYVSCTASLTNPDGQTQTINVPISGYTQSNAKVGTWSVSGSYGSVPPTTDTDSGYLSAGATLTLTLEFGEGSDPNGNGDGIDFIEWFNSQVWLRQIFTFGGIALIGIPILALVAGVSFKGKRPQHAPPHYPAY